MSACRGRSTRVEEGNAKQILHLGNQVEPADLDPHTTTGVSEINIHMALFEGLVTPDPMDLSPIPGVAERWSVSDDGRTYTFFLRADAKWSNGETVSASDFRYSVQRILSPSLAAANATLLYPIEHAREFHMQETSDFSRVGVKVHDPQVLEVTLRNPIPYFLSLLMHPAWYPVHRDTVEKAGPSDRRGTGWTRPPDHVGNGPFRLLEWRSGSVVQVERNPHYWDIGRVQLRAINFYPIDNLNTEELAFLAEQLHVTESIPGTKVPRYREAGSPYLRIDPYLGTEYYALNVQKAPLNDPRVRRALNLALDRASLVDNVTRRGERPAFHFTPSGISGYTATSRIREDVVKARRLLAQAGFSEGRGFPKLTLLFNTSENHRALAEAVQHMWKKNLNVEIGLRNQEYRVYLNTRSLGDFDIARSSWIGDYLDPDTFLSLWTSQSGNNHSRWSNEEYDRLISDAEEARGRQRRYALFQEAESILMGELPLIPLYFNTTAYLIQPSVENWHANLLDWHPYQYVYLAP